MSEQQPETTNEDESLLPAIGATIRCEKCPCVLELPAIDFRQEKSAPEQFATVWRAAEPKGWAYRIVDSEEGPQARFTCPSCIQVDKIKMEMSLSAYSEHATCPKCGGKQLGT